MNTVNYCDAYLKQLQAEHHRLNSAVLEIRHKLQEFRPDGEKEAKRDSMVAQLEGLLTQLQTHFSEEEDEEGLLQDAVLRCRSVRSDVKALMDEHSQLTAALQRLLVDIKSGTIDGDTCRQMFDSFATQLKTHECIENTLLQTALGGDTSECDVEGNE